MLASRIILRRSSSRISSTSSFIPSIASARVGDGSLEGRLGHKSQDIPQRCDFSSAPSQVKTAESTKIVCPPNLKIDPRAFSSPFYGLEKVDVTSDIISEEESTESDEVDTERLDDGTISSDDTPLEDDSLNQDSYDIESNDADDFDEGTIYDLDNKPEPIYAVPLPQRLHVPILHLSTDAKPEEVGSIHLSAEIFGQDPIREDILHRCIIYQRNKKRGRRNGGARTKTIAEVSGSGRKVRPQKGQGTARAGHSRPPHWRGGAKAHGPKGSIQNYETKLNKKVRKMGIKMALSQKLKEGNLILIDTWDNLGSFKTNALAKTLNELGDIGGRFGCNAFLIDHVPRDADEGSDDDLKHLEGCHVNLKVASRNLHQVKVSNQQSLNVYDLLKHEKLVMSLSALEKVEERMIS